MPAVSGDVWLNQVLAALAEAFGGPAQGWGYFTDRGPEAGLFGALRS